MSALYPQSIISAVEMLGSPYLLGAKWEPKSPARELRGPVDCSGFARWVLSLEGIEIPDGSHNQILVCSKLPPEQQQNPPPLSLGFFKAPGAASVDHVVVSVGTGVVIEARGEPYNCVILRPAAVWLAQPGFLGFYAPPKPKGE
jgi:cell wall-associated NlpC family hydrolase